MADTTNATPHEMTAATSGTSAPGVRVVQGAAHEMTAAHAAGDTAGELYIMPAAYDADTVTTRACRTHGSDRFGPLKAVIGGSVLEDRTDIVSTRVNDNYDGDLQISCTSIAESSISGIGVIDYVVLYADCRIAYEGVSVPVVTDAKFILHNEGGSPIDVAMLETPPIGLVGSVEFATMSTAHITTRDGTNAWDWATLFADLSGLTASVHVHYTGSRVQADAAVMWAEVYGPIGARATPIVMRQKLGSPIRKVVTFNS